MRKLIVATLLWLLAKLRAFPEGDAQVLAKLRELIHVAQSLNMRGERKRSYVLNRIQAEFPNIPTRDLAFLLEQLVRELD